MPIAENNGVNLYYRDFGQGEQAVVFVHGLGLSGSFWFDLPERLLEESAKSQRVIAIDNRGTGRSSAPLKPFKLSHMADDLNAILEHAGVSKAIVVGISMGGMIAQHFAIRHPDKAAGLLLIATSAGLPHARIPHISTIKKLAELPFIAQEDARQSLAELLLPKAEEHNWNQHLGGWTEVMKSEKPRSHAFLLQLGAVTLHYTGKKLRNIHCPTVIITGDEDMLVPPVNSQILQSMMPHAQLEILPSVGHAVEALAPEAIIRNVDNVLTEAL